MKEIDLEQLRLKPEMLQPKPRTAFVGDPQSQIDVRCQKQTNGLYVVYVTTSYSTWTPRFGDLHKIVYGIGWCEDQKYCDGARRTVAAFLTDAVHEPNYSVLAKKYELP